jgi:hypothetical protein
MITSALDRIASTSLVSVPGNVRAEVTTGHNVRQRA